MLKEQKANIFMMSLLSILIISLSTPVAKAPLNIDTIFMTSSKSPEDWVFELWVNLEDPGSLHQIDVTLPPGGVFGDFTIYEDPYCGWEYDSSPTDYPSLSALQTDYPTGTYTLDFRDDSSGDPLNSVTLDYSSLPGEPLSYVNFTYPEYDEQTGIPTDPTFWWTVDPGAGDALAMWLSDGVTDELIYENVPVSTTTESWSPGTLQPYHYYDLTVSVFNAKDLGIGPALPTKTVGDDQFKYCLMNEYLNETKFTTTPVPGAVFLGAIGVGMVGWLCRHRAQ